MEDMELFKHINPNGFSGGKDEQKNEAIACFTFRKPKPQKEKIEGQKQKKKTKRNENKIRRNQVEEQQW